MNLDNIVIRGIAKELKKIGFKEARLDNYNDGGKRDRLFPRR